MRNIYRAAIAGLFAAQLAAPAFAQLTAANAPAASLNELLDRVQNVRQADNEAFEKNKAAYNAASADQQAKMLKDAQAHRDELQAASDKLTDTYSANEVQIGKLNADLTDKADKLGLSGLFGLAKQTATDLSAVLEQSMIATQFPVAEGETDRVKFLRDFAGQRTTPTPQQLERLWFEIHREMTGQAQVARYQAKVVEPNGEPQNAEVIRIGPFTASSNGRFLSYVPTLRTFTVLPSRLPSELLGILGDFEKVKDGYARAVVDQTRGVLMSLYVERPTWLQRVQLGEAVGYVIIAVGLAGALAFLFQLLRLIFIRVAVGKQLRSLDKPSRNNPLGRVLLAFKGDPNKIEEDADVAELRISEAVLREVPRLEAFQAFLRLAVAAGPLLGLIGTVVGMIYTFQSITESGSSDPRLMATGIGQAMIATVLGLGIAIPLLFANALLNSLSRGVVQILDEQSAGMLAESIERQRGV